MSRLVRLKVKEIAQAKGISQRQLVRRTGLDSNLIRRIFRFPDEQNPTIETLGRIAEILEVDVSALIENNPDKDEKYGGEATE